jgi:hypothetical protein
VTDDDRAIYLYAVCAGSDDTKIEATGVGGGDAPVRRLRADGLAAIVSDVPVGPLTAARDLRSHWRVLEEAASHATVLPVRFGTVLDSEHAVRSEFLDPNAERLKAVLEELEGKAQLTVKGFYDEDRLMRAVVERSPEVARLRERTRQLPEAATYYDRIRLGELVASEVERLRADDTDLVLARLEPLAVAATAEAPTTRDGAVNAAFLVERARIDAFTERVRQLTEELGERVRLRYIGPLPPYSFADEEAVGTWA